MTPGTTTQYDLVLCSTCGGSGRAWGQSCPLCNGLGQLCRKTETTITPATPELMEAINAAFRD